MKSTIIFKNKPCIAGAFSIVGPKESQGPLGKFFDYKLQDDMFGEKTFEKGEMKILYTALSKAIENSGKNEKEIDAVIAGDLLNQIIASSFSARRIKTGFLGVYNACSTFSESLIIGSTLIDGGYLDNVVCGTSSHFSTAERQYRFPLEFGAIRPPQAQWTVTGSGACVLSGKYEKNNPVVTMATIGKVIDYGVKDVYNMGACMAPAGMDTLTTFFKETKTKPSDYDLIVSGDLGAFGSRVLKDLMKDKGYDISSNHVDCGELIYNIAEDEYQGGSGAGCSSSVFCSYLYKLLKHKKLNKIILMATGALLSTLSSQQGESIPSIAHLVVVENI